MDNKNSENKLPMNQNPRWNTPNIFLKDGNVFSSEKINELVEFIIDKFAENKLTVSQGEIVLKRTKELLNEFSVVKSIDF